eukprot:CAMPEP_0172623736 /NCGR_PEP_ID=MMETSP1068-20121228/131135_1 /TAXON_ID=35684 /ORGANISM="Pseudopedinella elastica, Strain CCMP716" /LENGTH=252 /DNA_ID=CAMNT_0013432407 /DNA_START=86 /DNA_END=841 /DNA_ORIENTATION=+
MIRVSRKIGTLVLLTAVCALKSLAFIQSTRRSLCPLPLRTSSAGLKAHRALLRRSTASADDTEPIEDLENRLEELFGEMALIEAIEERNKAQIDSFVDAKAQWDSMDDADRYLLGRKTGVDASINNIMADLKRRRSGTQQLDNDATALYSGSSSLGAASAVLLAAVALTPAVADASQPSGSAPVTLANWPDELTSLMLAATGKDGQTQLAAALVFPLATYKAAAVFRGQKLLPQLDLAIFVAIFAALKIALW